MLKSVLYILLIGLLISCAEEKNKTSDKKTKITISLNYTFKNKEAEALSFKAFDLQSQNNLHEAIVLHNKAISIEPDNPKLYFDISNCYYDIGDYNESLKKVDSAILLDSTNASFYNNRGLTNWKLYNDTDAEHDYKKAISLDSTNWAFYSNLSIVYFTNKNNEEACRYFKKSQELGITSYYINEDRFLIEIEALCDWNHHLEDLTKGDTNIQKMNQPKYNN